MNLEWEQQQTNDRFGLEALTFDDVLLQPRRSEVTPAEVNLATKLTKDIRLNLPLLSSPMDTVTESRMAISMAREGGMGFIHKSLAPDKQAAEVARVKRSENGVIVEPITCSPDDTIRATRELMQRHGISGVLVVEGAKALVGIVTHRDVLFETNLDRPVRDVMTKDVVTSGPETTLDQAQVIMRQHKVEKLPLADSHGALTGLVTLKDILKIKRYPHAAKDEHGRLLVGAAVGVTAQTLERVAALVEAGVDAVIIDSAHGHSKGVMNMISAVHEKYPNLPIIGGNVATYEGARDLCELGVSAVRVGVGPGSICTTRIVAGIGVPQLTAIAEAVRGARPYDVPVIADGGIRYSGDIVKALAAGAHTVMIGSLLAGTDESPGATEIYQGRQYKVYRGMGSVAAMEEGSPERYFQEKGGKLVPEGIEGRVPYRGGVADTVFQLAGGLRSGMGYTGSATIDDLRTQTTFVRISPAGMQESHPHDVQITREAPNYTVH